MGGREIVENTKNEIAAKETKAKEKKRNSKHTRGHADVLVDTDTAIGQPFYVDALHEYRESTSRRGIVNPMVSIPDLPLFLWSNELPGLGYGLATLCLPNGGSAPDAATGKAMMAANF